MTAWRPLALGAALVVAGAVGCESDLGTGRPGTDGGRRSDGGTEPPDGATPLRDGSSGDGSTPPGDSGVRPDGGGSSGDMVRIPAGSFLMGCNSTEFCYPDEEPPRTITMSSFEIDRTEVTRAAYRECVRASACTAPSVSLDEMLDHPVHGVSWAQADAYCRWAGKRLPTEAQWERAARGTDGRYYPWGNELPTCDRVNFTVNPPAPPMACVGDTSPVGSHPSGASPDGALDMSGNVWEWTSTPYVETYYRDAADTDRPDPPSGTGHTYRGGSYTSYTELLDVWLRQYDDGSAADMRRHKGFRCAR